MKLKEYATKIKNRLMGQNTKPQKEEKDDLSEQILERTQEMIKEDRQEAVRAAAAEESEEITEQELKTEEKNNRADAMWLATITKGLTTIRKELISNNRRKMKGMPMIRAKALEKARKNKRRKPKK